jgi:hypothetical protein
MWLVDHMGAQCVRHPPALSASTRIERHQPFPHVQRARAGATTAHPRSSRPVRARHIWAVVTLQRWCAPLSPSVEGPAALKLEARSGSGRPVPANVASLRASALGPFCAEAGGQSQDVRSSFKMRSLIK